MQPGQQHLDHISARLNMLMQKPPEALTEQDRSEMAELSSNPYIPQEVTEQIKMRLQARPRTPLSNALRQPL
jgi:hypothetical protein